MFSSNLFVALLLLSLFTMKSCVVCFVDFHVGVILDLDSRDSSIGHVGMHSLSMAVTDFYSLHADYKTRIVLHPIDSNGSIVDAAAAALHLLRDVKVDAIIGPQKSAQVNCVMDLGERAHVPIISFSATSPFLSHRSPYFVQTAQSDANQVQAIASIVKEFMWTEVLLIYEDTEFGNGIISHLSNALQDVRALVPYRSVLPRSATDDHITDELQKMMRMQTRVIVVHVCQFLATRLFLKAREVGMMSEGYAWIVTSGLTDLFSSFGSDAAAAMEGVLGVRPLIPKSKEFDSFASRWRAIHQDTSIFGVWAYDTLWALGMAAETAGHSRSSRAENEGNANLTALFSPGVSGAGPELLKVLSGTRFPGLAGEFNLVKGQLVQTAYEVVNIVETIQRPVGKWTPTGLKGMTSKGKFRSIIWPGDSTKPPRGWDKGRKLRIAVPHKPGFNNFMTVTTDPHTNKTNFSGYYREVFDAVMIALPYVLEYDFIAYPFLNSDGSRAWSYDDLVRQVSLQREFDGALGDITITADRSNYVDFTLPYAEGGVACIVPIEYEDVNDALTFFQPLSIQLWVATAVLYVSTLMITWILANKLVHSSRDLLAQRAGIASLFPFFPGEGIQVSLICLILVSWALVANLFNSAYTAKLSSRLTLARLRPTATDVEQLKAKGDYVGYQDGSFLENHLVRRGFNRSKLKKYTNVVDCTNALNQGSKKGGISAYCDVLPHIRAILKDSCAKYKMIHPIYRTDGFALAFHKGFPALAAISKAIVEVMENGRTIPDIDQLLDSPVPDDDNQVSLRRFAVLFSISGSVTLLCLLLSLLIHLHSKRSLPQRITEFINASVYSLVLAFRLYLRRKYPSCRPPDTEPREETPHVDGRIMEIEIVPPHNH